jgi:hypothetical protein
LEEGKPGSIAIRGVNLWKNPRVMIGTAEASRISILSDMQGLVADFTSVPKAAYGPDPTGEMYAPVWLATADGQRPVGYVWIQNKPTNEALAAGTGGGKKTSARNATGPGNVKRTKVPFDTDTTPPDKTSTAVPGPAVQ